MQSIQIKIRRMNAFCISNTCNPTDLFHSSTSVYRLMSRNHFRHRAQRVLRAQHLMTSCPTRQPTEAAARAQRRLSYKPCPRRVPLRGMRSETKGSAPQRAEARRRAVGERQAPPAAGVPVEGAGAPGVAPPVGEPPCCALAPCFFLSRCTKLTA